MSGRSKVKVQWKRGEDGYVESKCGRFKISPLFFGRCAAQGYSVTDWHDDTQNICDTQKLCKEWANKKAAQEWPKVFYTFAKPHGGRDIYIKPEPSSFNGSVDVIRYRITIERVDEPEEEKARLTKLWRECDNNHQWASLDAEAARLKLKLDPADRGKDRKRYR